MVAKKEVKMEDDGFEKIGAPTGAGGKNFLSFSKTDEGFTLIGEFIEIADGTYGPEASVLDDDGVMQVFVLTAGLKGPMSQVNPGDKVKITHLGLKESKNFKGKSFRSFDVAVKRKR